MSERKGMKALEVWCKRLVKNCPNVQIDNMTTSWRNGMAFCALVHHFRPDLIDMATLNPDNIYYNNQLAFSIAETQLGIPALLDPEDMVENEIPDRLSILTYLSQFYQRLGNTVASKLPAEGDQRENPPVSPLTATSPMKFVKSGFDKCSTCGLPVYLAQRLIVSNKLYHRRCFRCSKCDCQLSPNSSFDSLNGSEFCCDSCKSEKKMSKYLNNNDDRMGMLNFTEPIDKEDVVKKDSKRSHVRPKSMLERISMFEKNAIDDGKLADKVDKLALTDGAVQDQTCGISNASDFENCDEKCTTGSDYAISKSLISEDIVDADNINNKDTSTNIYPKISDDLYKSNINKFNFLQTQLSNDIVEENLPTDSKKECATLNLPSTEIEQLKDPNNSSSIENSENRPQEHEADTNVTDDIRLASSTDKHHVEKHGHVVDVDKIKEKIIEAVPPRRKKHFNKAKITNFVQCQEKDVNKVYPDSLNPFSDDEDEVEVHPKEKSSTNPFGSSDEDNEDDSANEPVKSSTPNKHLVPALNPFWSDGEEPSSEDEMRDERSSKMYKSAITASTPNLGLSTPRRKKPRAPPPPPIITVTEFPNLENHSHSTEDMASLSSVSSYASTAYSDHKTPNKLTPKSRKSRPAPTPPDGISMVSTSSRDFHNSSTGLDKSHDASTRANQSEGGLRKVKGPAPGLPLPERREVKPQISPEQLQDKLDLLEAQQLGLERQGVLIEQMIRDRCEGDEATTVSQDEVEDLVIQLCELVNEKNDLFRKQTELMYIRRQQRLEQEQADIEHEIRIIQARPAVNRIDADKAREEHLVSRLVEIVKLRDELVQQLDSERRRERQEDLAIAASIAERRAQRNSDSNTSSMASVDVARPSKKTKVKDKVKKQLKKAKHSLNIKKKDDQDKDKPSDKEHKAKWF